MTKLCVKDGVTVWVTIVCSKLCVKERGGGGGGGGGGGRGAGYRIKNKNPHKDVGNKNPTQRCGEHISIFLILILRFNF